MKYYVLSISKKYHDILYWYDNKPVRRWFTSKREAIIYLNLLNKKEPIHDDWYRVIYDENELNVLLVAKAL